MKEKTLLERVLKMINKSEDKKRKEEIKRNIKTFIINTKRQIGLTKSEIEFKELDLKVVEDNIKNAYSNIDKAKLNLLESSYEKYIEKINDKRKELYLFMEVEESIKRELLTLRRELKEQENLLDFLQS